MNLQRLVAILRGRGAVMERDLLKSSGIPRPTLMRLLRLLESKSLIERRRHGQFTEITWMGGDVDIETVLEAGKKLKKSFSPLPAIVRRLFEENDNYVAIGWYGLLYPEIPFVVSHSRVEFLVSYDVLKRIGENEVRVEVDEMEYEVKLYTAPQNMLKARTINSVKIPQNPLKTWFLTRSLTRGVPEELAELILATYSPISSTLVAQAIRAKLLSLITGKELVVNLRLGHPIILRYGDVDVNVDWLDDLWKRGIMLYLDEWSAKRAVKKLISTTGYEYVITGDYV